MTQTKLIAKKPSAGSPRSWEFPRFTRTRLDSGMEVILAPAPGRALAAARLRFEAGASNEPEAQDGVAAIAVGALTEGTEDHKGPAFIQAVERLGGDIFATCDWDSFTVNLRVPMNRMEPALELLAEAVRRPAFSSRDVERLRQERLGVIMQEYANAITRSTIAFDKLIYTPDSAYCRSDHGTYWSVAQLGKRKAEKYYRRVATPSSATLIIVGDIEGFAAIKIAEKLFGDWRGKEPQRLTPVVRPGLRRTSVVLVDRPESEQSQIDIGHVGVPRSSPDYFPLIAMMAALGGLFGSRLNRRLREEKGYTYGARAGISFRRQAGPLRASSAVETPVTVDAVAETIDVLQKTHDEGITKQELQEVKDHLTGAFTVSYETPEAIASGLSTLVDFGLPDDYFETYRSNIEKVTLDEANQAAADHLHPDQLAIVVVGDREEVYEPLLGADFGPVAIIEDPEPGEPPTS